MDRLFLLLITILPTIILGKIIYNKDKDKEPLSLLLSLFLYGVFAAILVIVITPIVSLFIPFFAKNIEDLNLFELLIYVFVGIAFIEELAKWFFTYKIAYKTKEFDQLYDVIVYAAFISLGFATFENALYVSTGDLLTGFIRAIASVPGHAFYGVFMGYYLGLAKLTKMNGQNYKSKNYIILSIFIPTLLHGVFDYTLFTEHWLFLFVFIIFVIFLYFSAFKKINQFSRVDSSFNYKTKLFCSKCGLKIEDGYCKNCGSKPSI